IDDLDRDWDLDIGIAAHTLGDTIDILLDGGVFEGFGPPLKPARPLAADIHLCCFGLDFHPHVVEIESWSGQGCGFLRLSGNRQRKSQNKQCPNGPADSDADHIPQARSMNHQISSRMNPILEPSGNVCHRNKLMLRFSVAIVSRPAGLSTTRIVSSSNKMRIRSSSTGKSWHNLSAKLDQRFGRRFNFQTAASAAEVQGRFSQVSPYFPGWAEIRTPTPVYPLCGIASGRYSMQPLLSRLHWTW